MNTRTDHQIIKTKPEDLLKVRRILECCGLPSQDLTKDHMQHFFIVKSDTKPIGTIGLEIYDRHGLLRSLAVRSGYRGSGLGKLLVQKIESYARYLDIDKIYLLTTTANEFFQYLDYTEISRSQVPELLLQSEEFAQICPSSAVTMIKQIGRDG